MLSKLPEGAWSTLHHQQLKALQKVEDEHKARVTMMTAQHQQARAEMEAKCLADHGHHLGDGGFLFSTCVRCGRPEEM